MGRNADLRHRGESQALNTSGSTQTEPTSPSVPLSFFLRTCIEASMFNFEGVTAFVGIFEIQHGFAKPACEIRVIFGLAEDTLSVPVHVSISWSVHW